TSEPPESPPVQKAEATTIAIRSRSLSKAPPPRATPWAPAQPYGATPAPESGRALSVAEPAPPEMPQPVLLTNVANVVAVATGSSVGGGTLLGKVILRGTPRNPDQIIRTGADPKCKHSEEFTTENWKVAADGSLADVVVWL